MVRKKDKSGRFNSDGEFRNENLTIRISNTNKEKIKNIADKLNVSVSDLINSWIEFGCPLWMSSVENECLKGGENVITE